MMHFLKNAKGAARRFWKNEDGNGTIEFMLALPLAMAIFTASYESGILETRHVMLERGLDVTVRKVRIGSIPEPDHDILKAEICATAAIIPNCLTQVKLEMIRADLRNWTDISKDPDCVDREEEGDPSYNFTNGDNNELMVLRVCALFDPFMPSSTLGAAFPKESGGAYALVATSSYVLEPFK